MQQGADDAVDAVDDEDAQEIGHGHDDEAQAPMMTATMQKTMKPRASLTRHERPDVTMWMP